jgi:hypothetical protein
MESRESIVKSRNSYISDEPEPLAEDEEMLSSNGFTPDHNVSYSEMID